MAKTGEPGKETEQQEEVELQVGEDGGECSTSVQSDDTYFLSEMNLLIVFCSLCSLSNQENPSACESDKEIVQDDEAKACVPRLHTRRRQNHETKLVGRRTSQRFHTSVKDFRHGRRM